MFSRVTGRRLWPLGNRELMLKKGDAFEQDTFRHEQYLVLEEKGKRILISGCAHNGILNILDRYRELYGSDPDAVISGFHMSRKPHYSQADLELVRQTGEELRRLPRPVLHRPLHRGDSLSDSERHHGRAAFLCTSGGEI